MSLTSWLAFSIDRVSRTPVFEQICGAIRNQIVSGELAAGSKLPPTRAFATELGLSRSTVVTAYEQLVAEGYLHGRQGSGYTVCELGEVELPPARRAETEPNNSGRKKSPVPFEASLPDMRLFPHRQWAKGLSRLCRNDPESLLRGGGVFGCAELRAAIADHVAEWRGIDASAEQIIVTAGATDALEICMRGLSAKGQFIGLEDPGYLPMRRFAESHGLIPEYLSVDCEGALIPGSGTRPRLVILTPSHQYPLGGAMSPQRRLAFIQWAKETDSWIIEDDYDSEFRYAGRPIPAMAGFDRLNRTIYIGSFSKIFSNTLRLGYLVVPKALVGKFHQTIGQFGVKASYLPQPALASFMASGDFYRHLRRVRRVYGERRKFLLERLSKDLAGLGFFRDHNAGMQVVFHLNEGFSDVAVAEKAKSLGLTVSPLSKYSAEARGVNGLVLGYCAFSESEMDEAMPALKASFDVL